MTRRLVNKTALITGGGNGIGRASALRFASEGASVVIADVAADAAEETAAEIRRLGGNAKSAFCDVGEESQVNDTVATVIAETGRIDVLFNCAGGGTGRDGPVTELDLQEFWRTVRVDLFGTLLFCRRVIPEMAQSGGGSIINMTSVRAVIGTCGADAYTASKGGVLAMTRAMAAQWAEKKIRVNAIAAGVVLTERVKRLISENDAIFQKSLLGPAEPGDVAALAAYLASDEARQVTGAVHRLDGGSSAC